MSKSKYKIPYALVPDFEGYPENSPLMTFEWEIDESIADKLVDAVNDYDYMPDGLIIKEISVELFDELMNEAKRLSPDWKEYAELQIYIPESIHMMAYIRQMTK